MSPRFPEGPNTLGRLKWTFLLTLVVLFVFVEFGRYNLFPYLDTLGGRLLMDLVILAGSVFFFGAVFDFVARMQKTLSRQNRELLALHGAALDIYGEISLRTVLKKVVDQAGQLLEARYAAVAVYGDGGRIKDFVTSGISEERQTEIGAPPRGIGLLGIPLRQDERLRIPDVRRDPRSAGIPSNHPVMHSLLAVPIHCKSPFRGNLYLANKKSSPEFTAEDEETMVRFATSAAIAIDNAHLNTQLRTLAVAEERVRIARELHDGMAQVLAYVNAKAQAVKAYLDKGKTEQAGDQLEQLAAAARDVYTDAREGILALRTQVGPGQPLEDALKDFLGRWETQSGIDCDLEISGELQLPMTVELQVLRIIQEALTNARKHSGTKATRVQLVRSAGFLSGVIEDDGVGFDPSMRSRGGFPQFGLAIMRERAESVGGTLEIDSQPGKGTRVRMEIPVKN